MLTYGVVLLHDSAHPHTSTDVRTRALLELFNLEFFDDQPHSPDLTLSDYHLLTCLKNLLRLHCFSNNEELMGGAKTWLSSQAADFFYAVIKNIFPDRSA
jgi:hypothetical protein